MSRFEDRRWLARVCTEEGVAVGGAWALDGEHLLTCAHVVLDAGAQGPGDAVRVYFPQIEDGCKALVLHEGWTPESEDGMTADWALLKLTRPPAGMATLPTCAPLSLDGLDFSIYGFPAGYKDGLSTEGRLGRAAGRERVQLEVDSALLIQPGFSGGAVWSGRLGAVVGMLTARHRESEGRIAFAIPMRVIAQSSQTVREALQTPLDMDPDRITHWGPRSRGVSSDRDEEGWLFSGRERALTDLVRWFAGRHPAQMRVVTGTPGSGKSAVLARLVTSADRHYRQRITDLHAEHPTVPPLDVFDVTFHARERTVNTFVEHVARLTDTSARDGGQLLGQLDERDRRLTIVVDAVDEATEPNRLCELLTDLALKGHRVLAGCRPHLLGKLGDPDPIRLDEPPYLDPDDIRTYVARLFSQAGLQERPPLSAELPEEIAQAAAGNFLVAQLIAHAILLGGREKHGLPQNVSQAFELMLDRLPDKVRARDLLFPLAFAFGDGLPRDLWLSAARALRRPYQLADLDELLSSPASSFLVTRTDIPSGRRYRLFHEALVETLTHDADQAGNHEKLLSTWIDALPEADGHADWEDAHPYLWMHVADHAAGAGALDQLVQDLGYLPFADPVRLLRLLASLQAPQAHHIRRVYTTAFDTLRQSPPAERASYLEMTARQAGINDLADRIAQAHPNRPWATRWALWQSTAEHFIVGRHQEGWVHAVALGQSNGKPIALSAGTDATLRVWDLETLQQRGPSLIDRQDIVRAVALGQLNGKPIALSGGDDWTLRVWDLDILQQHGPPLAGHQRGVHAVALGQLNGKPIALSAAPDKTLRVWDLDTFRQHDPPLTGHEDRVIDVASGQLNETPIALSAALDETLRVWDLDTLQQHGPPLRGHDAGVETVAFGQLNGKPIALSGGNDRTLRVWDLDTFQQHGPPLTGHEDSVLDVAFGQLNKTPIALSAALDETLRVWDLDTFQQYGPSLTGHQGVVRAVALGQLNGKPIALSGGDDGTLRAWDLDTLQPHGPPLIHRRWGPVVGLGQFNGKPTALVADSSEEMCLWDLDTLQEHWPPRYRRPLNWPVALGQLDGKRIVLFADDNQLRVWDFDTSQEHGPPLAGHHGRVRAVALGKLNGKPIALGGGYDKTLRIWDLDTFQQHHPPLIEHEEVVKAVAFGQLNGKPIALSAGTSWMLRIWDLGTFQEHAPPLWGHNADVKTVALGQLDGKPIALCGTSDAKLHIWELEGSSYASIVLDSVPHYIAWIRSSAVSINTHAGVMLIDLSNLYWSH